VRTRKYLYWETYSDFPHPGDYMVKGIARTHLFISFLSVLEELLYAFEV